MTATIHRLSVPVAPAELARLEAMSAARAILRSPHPHSDDDVAWACATIKALADHFDPDERADVLAADAMLMAIGKRRRDRAIAQLDAGQPGMIRRELLRFGALVFLALGLVFWMGIGK